MLSVTSIAALPVLAKQSAIDNTVYIRSPGPVLGHVNEGRFILVSPAATTEKDQVTHPDAAYWFRGKKLS